MKPAAELACHELKPVRSSRVGLDLLVLGAFCFFLFFFGAGRIGLIGADEPRYAQIAREMLARHDWVTPILQGRPWLEKPILYYWQAMLSYRLFGISDWAARLPSAFDATAMIAAVYFFVRHFWPNVRVSGFRVPVSGKTESVDGFEVGSEPAEGLASLALETGNRKQETEFRAAPLDAALITASCAFVLGFAHAASTDMPLAASFTMGMLAWITWWQHSPFSLGRGLAQDSSWGRPRVWLLGFYFFMGLGTLAKGPVAPLLAVLIISAFAALRRDRGLVRRTLWWPGTLLFFVITAPWYVLVQLRTGNFWHAFLWEHNLERFNTPVFGHYQPFWYFLPVTLMALAPWTILAVAGFVQAIRRKEFPLSSLPFPTERDTGSGKSQAVDFRLFLALWGAVPVVFFSFSDSKLPGYILPAVPPLAMLASVWLWQKPVTSSHIPSVLLIPHGLLAGATLSLALLSPYLLLKLRHPAPALTLALAAGVVFAGAILLGVRRLGVRALRLLTLLPVIVGLVFLLRIAAPRLDDRVSARGVAHEIQRLAPENAPVAVMRLDRELVYGLGFYLNRPIVHYELGEAPAGDHLLVSRFSNGELKVPLPDRRCTMLGKFPAQQLTLYWVERKQHSVFSVQPNKVSN